MKSTLAPAADPNTPQQEIALLTDVLNASQSITTYCEAIRHPETGQIVDFLYRIANEGVSKLIGVPQAQIVGQRMTYYFPSVEAIGLLDEYRNVVETRQSRTFEWAYEADGYQGWYFITATPLRDGMVLSFIDVTDRKRSEEKAGQQAHLYRTTLDASLNSILSMSAIRSASGEIIDFRIQTANAAVERDLGRQPADLAGKTLLGEFPGNIESGSFAIYARVTETGQPERFVLYYTDENGFEGWFEVSAVQQDPGGVVITFSNITDNKRAELAARQTADLLQSVLNATLTAVACYRSIRDETGQITDFQFTLANQTTPDVFGLSPEELYTKTICEMNPALRRSDAFAKYVSVAETGQSITLERDVRGRWYLVSVVRFNDGILTSSIDITENRHYRNQIESANRLLRQSNENLQSFAYVASHDLQEPLRKIRAFGDLLATQYADQLGQGADYIDRMQATAERMQVLIKDLLTLSRLTTQQQPFESVNLSEVVNAVLTDLETAIQDKQAEIRAGKLPTVPGDPLQLRQLFQNLLSNALKFSSETERPVIQLSSHPLHTSDLPPTLVPNGRAFQEIIVSDNGIGFDAERYRHKVFGAFQRLHNRQQYAGTGMGLAIVKKVIENHGGDITVSSQEGEGTTFFIYLPA